MLPTKRCVDVVLDLAHHTVVVAEGAPMSRLYRIGMEIRHDDAPAVRADARQLGVRDVEIGEVAEHEPAPDDVERLVGNGDGAHVRRREQLALARLGEHARREVDADGERDATLARLCQPPRDAAADVEEAAAAHLHAERLDRDVLERADHRLRRVAGRPERVRVGRLERAHGSATAWRR